MLPVLIISDFLVDFYFSIIAILSFALFFISTNRNLHNNPDKPSLNTLNTWGIIVVILCLASCFMTCNMGLYENDLQNKRDNRDDNTAAFRHTAFLDHLFKFNPSPKKF